MEFRFVSRSTANFYSSFTVGILVYSLIVYGLASVNGLQNRFHLWLYMPLSHTFIFLLVFFCIGYGAFLIWKAARDREPHPLSAVAHQFVQVVNVRTASEVLLPIVALTVFTASFTTFKTMIGEINPFHLDQELASLDKAFHFGIHPWRLTHALVDTPKGAFWIDGVYSTWVVVIEGYLFWQITRVHRPYQRRQFLVAYALCWALLGSLAAYLMSSAGPCYFGKVAGGEDVYAPLMERLEMMDAELANYGGIFELRALNGQAWLWETFTQAEVAPAAGISAMPSLHVALATLLALSAWQVNRVIGIAMTFYAAAILFGSVHLGWHYAIDGYAAIIGAVLIWRLSGWMVGGNRVKLRPEPMDDTGWRTGMASSQAEPS